MGVFSKYMNIFSHVIWGSKINNPRAYFLVDDMKTNKMIIFLS